MASPHSSIANLYYQYGKYDLVYSQYVENERFALEYVVSDKAKNGLRLCRSRSSFFGSKWDIDIICPVFFDGFDIKKMAEAINNAHNLNDSFFIINEIFKRSSQKGKKVWKLIDTKKLSKLFNQHCDHFKEIFFNICCIVNTSKTVRNELWPLIDKKRIADNISQIQFFGTALRCINAISQIKENKGDDVWKLIDKTKLSKLFNRYFEDMDNRYNYPDKDLMNRKTVAKKIWPIIDTKWIADNISQIQDLEKALSYIEYAYEININLGDKVWKLLDKKMMTYKILNSQDLKKAIYFIYKIFKVNKNAGAELWELLDKQIFADNIFRASDFDFVVFCNMRSF